MKRHFAVWGLVLVMGACGCERKPADEPASFDPKVDSLSTAAGGRLDPGLLADQEQIAQASSKHRRAGATPSDPVEAAKQVLTQFFEAAKAQDHEKAMEFLTPEDAALLKPLAKVQKELAERQASVSRLVKERLDIDMQQLAQQGAGGPSGKLSPLSVGADESLIDKFQFKQTEGGVEASFAEGGKFNFVQVDGAWKIKLGLDPAVAPILPEFAEAYKGFLDDIDGGVNDGSITKENFQAKMQELMQARMVPVAAKLAAVMSKIAPGPTGIAGPAVGAEALMDISADFPLEGAKPADKELVTDIRQFVDNLAGMMERKQFDQAVALYDREDVPIVRPALRGMWMAAKTLRAIDSAAKKAQESNIDFKAAGKALEAAYDVSARDAIFAPVQRSLLELKPFTAADAAIMTADDKALVSTPAGGRLLLVKVEGDWKRRMFTGERKVLSAMRELYATVDLYWLDLIGRLNSGSIATQADLDSRAAELAKEMVPPAFRSLQQAAAPMALAPSRAGESPGAPAVRPGEPSPIPVRPRAVQLPAEAKPVEPNAPAAVEPNAQLQPEQQQDRGSEKAKEMRDRLLKPTKRLTGAS